MTATNTRASVLAHCVIKFVIVLSCEYVDRPDCYITGVESDGQIHRLRPLRDLAGFEVELVLRRRAAK